MIVSVCPSKIKGEIVVPSSKSVAHRALICAALSKEPSTILGNLDVGDILVTIDCLKALGIQIECVDGDIKKGVIVTPSQIAESATLNVNDSGSTLRFMLCVCAALGVTTTFTGTKRLGERPIKELLGVLCEHGISTSAQALPLTISGKLKAGNYQMDGSVSSQYITGLLLALPSLDGDSTLEILNTLVSKQYVDITLEVQRQFGVQIAFTNGTYKIDGSKKYQRAQIKVEADWSSACFVAAMGALLGKTQQPSVKFDSQQGDKVIANILASMGATVKTKDCLLVKKARLRAINFDATNNPDIVPILAVLCANAIGESTILGVERLVAKESDRLNETLEMLRAFQIECSSDGEKMTIVGGKPIGTSYTVANDHRMAMSATILAMCAKTASQLDGVECVKKSYPDFFEDVKKVGGVVDVR